MNRREFHRTLLAALGTSIAHPSLLRGRPAAPLRVDGERVQRMLRDLSEFGRTAEGGVSRFAYGAADLRARSYVIDRMREADLDVEIDAAGNILGRRAGRDPSLPPLMFGSHIDSVPAGGNYDGQVGSVGAIEVARTLVEHDRVLRHPVEVVIFSNEEDGKTGSRALSGEVMPKELDRTTNSGLTMREGITRIGGDPERLDDVRREPGDVAGYLELHVEQGSVLEAEGRDIGIVEGIVGIKRWYVTATGFANHAGTTPMDQRRDALVAAADFVRMVNRVVTAAPGRSVGTVGQIDARPGAPNVIPGEVRMSLELRDLDMDEIDRLFEAVRAEARTIGDDRDIEFSFDLFYVSRSAPTDERIQRLIADAARTLGRTTLHMPSGAGHDAQSIARLGPVGMIFVPSVGGISHSPEEYSRPEDIVGGVDTLLYALLALDETTMS